MARRAAIFVCFLLSWRGAFAAETLVAVDGRALETPPKIVREAPTHYPDFLARIEEYFRGAVTVRYVVGAQGELSDLEVVRATEPAFVPAAIEKLLASKFTAGTIGGTSVASRMTSVVIVDPGAPAYHMVADTHAVGNSYPAQSYTEITTTGSPLRTAPKPEIPAKSPPEYPPALQYDEAPTPWLSCATVYPEELLVAGTKGEARVKYIIDSDGRVSAAEIVSASRREFGLALLAAVERLQFSPAMLNGKATTTALFEQFRFSPSTPIIAYDDGARRILKLLRSAKAEFALPAALDEKPRVRYRVSPEYPRLLKAHGVKGEATIEFVLDRDGRARFPRIVSATHEEFGWAAATAVQQWFFDPPKIGGRPVDVLVTIPFGFTPESRSK